MLRLAGVLLWGFSLGICLALLAGRLPVPSGLIGVALMLLAALAVRRRWGLLADAAPGTPERQLWVSLAGHAVVGAHLLTTLLHIGPRMLMHTPKVHAMGIDSWTLVGGALLAYWIAREPHPRSDERDAHIAVQGLRAGYYVLVLALIALILVLGFVQGGAVGQLTHPMIAHGLILLLILSVLVDAFERLRRYAQDAGEVTEPAP